MRIWIDIKMPHEPLFFKSFKGFFSKDEFFFTSRDHGEINNLLETYNIDYDCIGNKTQGSFVKRFFGFLQRSLVLAVRVPNFDISLSHMSIWAILASKLRNRKCVVFYDNDQNPLNNYFLRFVDYVFVSKAINNSYLRNCGVKDDSTRQYEGYKEDIYLADYKPDSKFLSNLPFKDFVTVRPENLDALYHKSKINTLVPAILKLFSDNGINTLYLPRTNQEKKFSKGLDNIFVPLKPLNGLDICFYSKVVLTGSGTLAREAALMGIPSVSFYPSKLLSVDKKLISDKRMVHIRKLEEIYKYVDTNYKKSKKLSLSNMDNSKEVQISVFNKLEVILERCR